VRFVPSPLPPAVCTRTPGSNTRYTRNTNDRSRRSPDRDSHIRLNRRQAGSLPKDTVVFGTRVTVLDLDLDLDEEETFELVGPGQENPDKNRILTGSPIGQGLLGKK
jgi:transcription elongation GreA/GreB family factor